MGEGVFTLHTIRDPFAGNSCLVAKDRLTSGYCNFVLKSLKRVLSRSFDVRGELKKSLLLRVRKSYYVIVMERNEVYMSRLMIGVEGMQLFVRCRGVVKGCLCGVKSWSWSSDKLISNVSVVFKSKSLDGILNSIRRSGK